MGGSSSSINWYPPPESEKEGTSLVQLRIQHIQHAHEVVGEQIKGRYGTYTPVALVPAAAHSPCCYCCTAPMVSVPSGFSAIVTKWGGFIDGDEEGEPGNRTWSPGCHYFGLFYKVDFLVTKRLIVFDTPVKDCRTKDNAMVSINVMVVFEIVDAVLFVYKAGPEKLDDKLRAAQEEALRQMAMETEVDKVRDLFGTSTDHIIDELNEKFTELGVKIHHFTVQDVKIPPQQAEDSEEKTLFESLTTESRMKQAYDRLVLNNEEGKQKQREECDNAKQMAEQQAEVVKNKATKDTAEVVAQTARDIAELESTRTAEVKQIIANAELDVSKVQSAIMAAEREVKSRTEADCGRISAEAEAFCKQKKTDATLEVAQRLASGKTALGEAEGVASAAFAARRAHEAELQRLKIVEQVVSKQGMRIATSQENTMNLSEDNQLVTSVAQQGLEALRAKLAEVTTTSLAKLEPAPRQSRMK